MDLIYFKLLLLLNSWTMMVASPVAMHATSSQSFVIHQAHAPTSSSNFGSSGIGPTGVAQPSGNGVQSNYEYKYEVSDHQTGDRKSHWETREGDKVRGAYTVYEPDGALRRVEYTADSVHGFNAIVTKNGESKHFPPPPTQDPYSQRPLAQITDGYEPSSRGYIPERSTAGYAGERSRYLGQNTLDNPGTGFSVSHLKSPGDIGLKPY